MTLLVVEHPDWMLDAECTRANPELFYPEPGGSSLTAAKAVCARCTVTAECLAYALEYGEVDYGVWGGLSVPERRELAPSPGRGRRRRPAPIEHGTEKGARLHRRRGEPACAWCRDACTAAHRRRAEQRRSA
jgi:WhiB family redox-sensing transcriptional regulator